MTKPPSYMWSILRRCALNATIILAGAGCQHAKPPAWPSAATGHSVSILDDVAPYLEIPSMPLPDAVAKLCTATGARIELDTTAMKVAAIDPATGVGGYFRGVSTRVILITLLHEVSHENQSRLMA